MEPHLKNPRSNILNRKESVFYELLRHYLYLWYCCCLNPLRLLVFQTSPNP